MKKAKKEKNKGCFFTIFTTDFSEMKNGLVKSIKKFYPDHDIYEFQVEKYYYDCVVVMTNQAIDLVKKYGRAIYIETDSIMCSKCPELFDDYDLEMPLNNTPYGEKPFLNMGLLSIGNPKVLEDLKEIEIRLRSSYNEQAEQYAFNKVFYDGGYKTRVLDFPDKSYGIKELAGYPNARLEGKDIFCNGKKVCVMHFAGPENKDYNRHKWDCLRPEVSQRLKELTTDE